MKLTSVDIITWASLARLQVGFNQWEAPKEDSQWDLANGRHQWETANGKHQWASEGGRREKLGYFFYQPPVLAVAESL